MNASRILSLLLLTVVATICVAPATVRTARGQNATPSTKKPYERSAFDGVITGTVFFSGEAPPRKRISMDADPVCAKSNPNAETEDVSLTDGKLANVLVWVKAGSALDEYEFAPTASPAVLEHKRCLYAPRVLGIQTGQTLTVINADETTHNTHPAPAINREWNISQPAHAEPIARSFPLPEVPILFRDNQHPWERAYLAVLAHPFFAVTGQDGSFRIVGLPPGEYTLAAWHERFGGQEVKVMVIPYQSEIVNFTFKPEAGAH